MNLFMRKKDQEYSSNQKWTLASTTLGFALENMDVMFLAFALTSIASDLGINGAQAGLISTVTNFGMLAGGILFGIIGDRYGRVKTFSYTVFVFAFATAAMYFAKDIMTIYILRFIAGIGAGGEYGVGITLIAENFKRQHVGKLTSLAAIGGQVGAILAALLAAFILPNYGWRGLFLLGLLPVVLTYFVRRHVHESTEFIEVQAQQKANNQKPKIRELFQTPKLAYQTVGLMLMCTVQIAGYFGLMNWLPSIMQKQLNLSIAGSSLWTISTIIGMCLGMLLFGQLLDYFGPRLAFGGFLIASSLSVFGITLAFNQITLLLAGVIIGFFSNGMFGGYGAVISRLYPTHIRSTANNVIVNVGRAVGGFSSVVIGFLMDHYSLVVVMGFLSVLYIFSFIIMLTIPSFRKLGIVNE